MKSLLIIGSIFAALSVLLGAFGAHGLKNRLTIDDLAIFETAVRYQMYHALGILLMGIASFHLTRKLVSTPAYFLIFGVIIFSGSLFLLVFTNLRWLLRFSNFDDIFITSFKFVRSRFTVFIHKP